MPNVQTWIARIVRGLRRRVASRLALDPSRCWIKQSPEAMVQEGVQLLFGRPAEDTAIQAYAAALRDGVMTPIAFVAELMAMEEFGARAARLPSVNDHLNELMSAEPVEKQLGVLIRRAGRPAASAQTRQLNAPSSEVVAVAEGLVAEWLTTQGSAGNGAVETTASATELRTRALLNTLANMSAPGIA